jgi:hypothetical protein
MHTREKCCLGLGGLAQYVESVIPTLYVIYLSIMYQLNTHSMT